MSPEELQIIVDKFTTKEIQLQNTKEEIAKNLISLLNHAITYQDAYNYAETIDGIRKKFNDRNHFILNKLLNGQPKEEIVMHLVAEGFDTASAYELIDYVKKLALANQGAGINIEHTPKWVEKLTNIIYLNWTGDSCLEKLPEEIGFLTNLTELRLVNNGGFDS